MGCEYLIPTHLQKYLATHFSLFVHWSSKPRPRDSGYPSAYVCKDISDTPNRLNSPNKVVDVNLNGSSSNWTDVYPLAKKAGRQLISVIEPFAIPCTNANVSTDANANAAGKVVGRLVGFTGNVRIVMADGQERRPAINYPMVTGDRVTTGQDGRARIEMAGRGDQGAGMSVVNFGPGSEVVITELVREFERPVGLIEIIRGWIAYVSPFGSGDSNFAVRSAATVCGIRGTEFVARYDPQTDTADYHLKEGAIELRNGGRVLNLTPGQSVSVVRSQFGTVRPLDSMVWKSFVSEVGPDSKGRNSRIFVQNLQYTVVYQGKSYLTHYEKGTHEGRPIDQFFFWILSPNGYQAEQDGQKLWGRFVRVPSFAQPDQSNVVWWVANWKLNGARWVSDDKKGISVEVK